MFKIGDRVNVGSVENPFTRSRLSMNGTVVKVRTYGCLGIDFDDFYKIEGGWNNPIVKGKITLIKPKLQNVE